ncbi:unnamed protein product, partial [Ascophyllum nodosum]
DGRIPPQFPPQSLKEWWNAPASTAAAEANRGTSWGSCARDCKLRNLLHRLKGVAGSRR